MRRNAVVSIVALLFSNQSFEQRQVVWQFWTFSSHQWVNWSTYQFKRQVSRESQVWLLELVENLSKAVQSASCRNPNNNTYYRCMLALELWWLLFCKLSRRGQLIDSVDQWNVYHMFTCCKYAVLTSHTQDGLGMSLVYVTNDFTCYAHCTTKMNMDTVGSMGASVD